MKKVVRYTVALLALAAVAVVAEYLWTITAAEYRSRALWRQVEAGPGAVVDLAAVGPAGTETVFIFHPYYPDYAINEALGFDWPEVGRTSIGCNEGVNLVVFVRGGAVVGWFEHPRDRGDLKPVACGVGYPAADARFVVARDRERRAVLVPR